MLTANKRQQVQKTIQSSTEQFDKAQHNHHLHPPTYALCENIRDFLPGQGGQAPLLVAQLLLGSHIALH
jgi:hypothetical protein